MSVRHFSEKKKKICNFPVISHHFAECGLDMREQRGWAQRVRLPLGVLP